MYSCITGLPVSEIEGWLEGRWFDTGGGFDLSLFNKILTERWAREDREGLVLWSVKNGGHNGYSPDFIIASWAKDEPQRVIEFFREHPNPGLQMETLTAIAKDNPGLALQGLQDMVASGAIVGNQQEYYNRLLFQGLAKSSPAALEAARTLSRTFNLASSSLGTVTESLQFSAADGVEQVNRLSGELGRVNLQLARSTPGTADHVMLLDQRDSLLGQMSGYADLATSFAPDQTVQVRIGGSSGPLLVTGGTTATLSLATAADGTISFALAASPLTLSAGSLAGEAQGLNMVRNSRTQLDAVATSLIAAANTAQTANAALDGTAGQLDAEHRRAARSPAAHRCANAAVQVEQDRKSVV